MLYKHYSNIDDIKELLKLGDIEKLKEKVNPDSDSKDNVTIAYHRDLKEKKCKSMISKNLEDFNDILFDSWIGYVYLYDEKNSRWLYDNYSINADKLNLSPLDLYFENNKDIDIQHISLNEVKELSNNNYEHLIIQGCGGDLDDWVKGITTMLKDEGIVKETFSFDKIYCFENGDLTNLAFALDNEGINMSKLAMFRLNIRQEFGAMWLSDYIDNGYIKDVNI